MTLATTLENTVAAASVDFTGNAEFIWASTIDKISTIFHVLNWYQFGTNGLFARVEGIGCSAGFRMNRSFECLT